MDSISVLASARFWKQLSTADLKLMLGRLEQYVKDREARDAVQRQRQAVKESAQ